MNEFIKNEFDEHRGTLLLMDNLIDEVASTAQICINCLKNNGKILIFGNGGSAADAQHFAAELVGRYQKNRNGLAAIALTTDSSVITSIANDFGFENVFKRQIEAIANEGDVAIGISTSGKSLNVINAIKLASDLGCRTIGLTGKKSSQFNDICEVNLAIQSNSTPRIQEMHILIEHTLCHLIDLEFKH